MSDERTPLLQEDESRWEDPHLQFCALVGVPPSDLPEGAKWPAPASTSLYGRAVNQRFHQNLTYGFTATMSNGLLLSQVILGAALTGLGASESSHILITLFGAMNTVIAGLVAYLKSRGQPNRARMYRDDLERVVDEIENSEIMWLGITKHVLGYDEIDVDSEISVRSEVARLTRLYDRAVKNNTNNNPDSYMAGNGADPKQAGLRSRPMAPQPSAPAPLPAPTAGAAAAEHPAPAAAPEEDESPATAPPKKNDAPKDDKKADKPSEPAAASAPAADPDVESPATAKPKEEPKEAQKDSPAKVPEDDEEVKPGETSKEAPEPGEAPKPAADPKATPNPDVEDAASIDTEVAPDEEQPKESAEASKANAVKDDLNHLHDNEEAPTASK